MVMLRDYQVECVNKVDEIWGDHASALVSMATGTGKTVTFLEIVRRRLALFPGKKAMIVAHREELIEQVVRSADRLFGLKCEVEKGESRAGSVYMWGDPRIVVATVQTLISGTQDRRRYMRFKPEEFSTLVFDEAHHSIAASWLEVANWMLRNPKLAMLGVTATPDRMDEKSLRQLYPAVAYDYNLEKAIDSGWLVKPKQQFIMVRGLDLAHVRSRGGDLALDELSTEMEAKIQEVVCPIFEISAQLPTQSVSKIVQESGRNGDAVIARIGELVDRRKILKTLIFSPSVKHAKGVRDYLNSLLPDCAHTIDGETQPERRRELVREYAEGKFPYLTNCMVATEGFDDPTIRVVAVARPTKSRALYAQMVGRGTRPIASAIEGAKSVNERKAAIAASSKPDCIVIDLVGNSGKHELVTVGDLLAGKMIPATVIQKAKEEAQKSDEPVDMQEIMENILAEETAMAARRSQLVVGGRYELVADRGSRRNAPAIEPPTPAQRQYLLRAGFHVGPSMSKRQAGMLIGKHKSGTATPSLRQKENLSHAEFILWQAGMPKTEIIKQRGQM
jgi:superfamily II DNA or RNA helicase